MWKQLSLLAVVAMVIAGCATGAGGPSPEQQVNQALAGWKAAAEARDVDALMAYVSEDFESAEWPDKETYVYFVKDAVDMGYLDDAEVSTEGATIVVGNGKAVVNPVSLTASFGTASLELTFTEKDGKWLITDVAMETW